MNKLEEAAVWN